MGDRAATLRIAAERDFVPDKSPTRSPTGVTDEIIREEIQAHWTARAMRPVRRLYEWILHWAETPYAGKAMAALAFAEAIFFPVPADVLLIALCLGRPKRSFRWAAICAFWSIVGGATAMMVGIQIGEAPVRAAIDWIRPGLTDTVPGFLFKQYGFWTVGVAALTPVPYNICSWLAGFSDLSPWTYLAASAIFRPLRFFAVAGLVYAFGPQAKRFIEKYFELATVLFMILVFGAVVALKYAARWLGF